MAAALAPIGDLYKSQLRAVAGALGVPEEILAKPGSARRKAKKLRKKMK